MDKENTILFQVILLLVGILVFILPVPHTIAIRNIVSVFSLLLLIYIFIKEKRFNDFWHQMQRGQLGFFHIAVIGFSLWVLLQALLFSPEPLWALKESKQWFVALVYYAVGTMLAFRYDTRLILSIIFSALMLHIVFIDLSVMDHYLRTHTFLQYFGGLMRRDYASYVTNMVWMFLLADLSYRIVRGNQLLPIGGVGLFILIILTLFASVVEMTRNAYIPLFVISLFVIYFIHHRFFSTTVIWKKVLVYVIGVAILMGILLSVFKHDRRFSHVLDVFPVAMELREHKTWLNPQKYEYPKTENGERVNDSNYLRIAWAYAGLKMIAEYPMGVGYGRNAFAHALRPLYPDAVVGHSHSGIIDLTIGLGLAGLLLWLWLIGYLLYMAWKNVSDNKAVGYSIVLLFITSEYVLRSILDSNIRDHMLLTFMFCIGVVLMAIIMDQESKNVSSLHSCQ